MDNLFLPREIGSIETGPQTFAGTNVLNTSFIFTKEPEGPEPENLLNSVLVSNAGWPPLTGIFNFITYFDNLKPYYNKDENVDLFIVWFNNQWQIYDFDKNGTDPIYFSNQDVFYPWNVTIWNSINPIYNPVPTVTKVL
jgi:hypothetical protein